jgi:preprotein translocase subunit SecG
MSTKRMIEIVIGILSIITAITLTIIANNQDQHDDQHDNQADNQNTKSPE